MSIGGAFRGNFIYGSNTNLDDEGYAALWLEGQADDVPIQPNEPGGCHPPDCSNKTCDHLRNGNTGDLGFIK